MRTSRIATVVGVMTLTLALGTGAAAGFEPPGNEPAGLFSCNPSAVLGHPGGQGLANAMSRSGNPTAWNAHFNSDRVGNC